MTESEAGEGGSIAPSQKIYSDMTTEIDFKAVQESITALGLPEEDKQMLNRYLSTIIQYTQNPKTRALAYEGLQFIFRQLNPDTFISEINDMKYRMYLEGAGLTLYKLVHLKYMGKNGVDATTRTALFESTFNFMDLLFNRILYGRDKKQNVLMAQAKNPPRISTGGG